LSRSTSTSISVLRMDRPQPLHGLPLPQPCQVLPCPFRGRMPGWMLRGAVCSGESSMAGPPNLGLPIGAVSSIRPARFSTECSRRPEDPPSGPWSIMTPARYGDGRAIRPSPARTMIPLLPRRRRFQSPRVGAKVHYPAQCHPARLPLVHTSRHAAEAITPTSADSRCGSLSCGRSRTSERRRRK